MNINRKNYSKCMFADLSTGDCFLYCGDLFIKVCTGNSLNAFNCEDNQLTGFATSTLVSRIDIELTEV